MKQIFSHEVNAKRNVGRLIIAASKVLMDASSQSIDANAEALLCRAVLCEIGDEEGTLLDEQSRIGYGDNTHLVY